jgi:hypothetical protein
MNRVQGFYWVNISHLSEPRIAVAEWVNDQWLLCGSEIPHADDDNYGEITVLSGPLEKPKARGEDAVPA